VENNTTCNISSNSQLDMTNPYCHVRAKCMSAELDGHGCSANTRGNSLKQSFVKRSVCELVWFLKFVFNKYMGTRIRFSKNKNR
jgi:hypothetical protein